MKNIINILKDKPRGLYLYSPIYGKMIFEKVSDGKIHCKIPGQPQILYYFDEYGRSYKDGECLLFPSNEIRNWDILTWKKGDLLYGINGVKCLFVDFINENYTLFESMHAINECVLYGRMITLYDENKQYMTKSFQKNYDKEFAKRYTEKLNDKVGGELNTETMEIEKDYSNFKDGDTFIKGYRKDFGTHWLPEDLIFVYKETDTQTNTYLSIFDHEIYHDIAPFKEINVKIRHASVDEIQKFYENLKRKGKYWDTKSKKLVFLPGPFQKVMIRDYATEKWKAAFFSHYDEDAALKYVCTSYRYRYCVPYDEKTKKFLGPINPIEEKVIFNNNQ